MIGITYNMSIKSLSVCPRTNGIYKITNQKTGRFYIGRSEGKNGFYLRWGDHRRKLRKNTHENPYLQNSYDKHGESYFTFEILEIKDYGELLTRLESDYIVNLEAMHFQKGYNIKNENSATEFPKTIRENHPLSREFELLDPDGNLIKGKNLTRFCEELGIDRGGVNSVLRGSRPSYKGFKSTNPEFHQVEREYRLLSPEKELIIFNNQEEFAKQIGVHPNSVSAVLQGRYSNLKGYHLESTSPESQKHIDRVTNKKLLLNKGLGIIVSFVLINGFSVKYQVPSGSLYSFFSKKKNYLTQKHNWSEPTEEEMALYPIIEENF